MTYSDVIILRLTQLCDEKNITINRLATLFGASCIGNPCFLITSAIYFVSTFRPYFSFTYSLIF